MSAIAARKARLAAAKAQQEHVQTISPVPQPEPAPTPTKTSQRQPPRKRQRSVDVKPSSGAESSSDESEAEDSDGQSSSSSSRSSSPPTPAQVSNISWFKPVWEGSQHPHNASIRSATKGKGKERAHDEAVVLRIAAGQSCSVKGIAHLDVTQGEVSINGCRLTPQSGRRLLVCPSTDPLPLLTAGGESGDEAIVEFYAVSHTGLEELANVCPLAGPDPFGLRQRRDAQQLLLTPQTNFSLDGAIQRQPPSWQAQWDDIQSHTSTTLPQVVLVRGAKGAGKSTFGRTLLNIYAARHERVALLDVDLGQGQLGPPGSVHLYLFDSSHAAPPLVSPSWLTSPHLASPHHSIFLGQTTPKDMPSTYFHAVARLIQQYDVEMRGQGVPLVVNTMGWSKGMGAELNERIEALLRPNQVYDLVPMVDPFAGEGGSAMSLPAPSRTPYGAQVTSVQAIGLDMRASSRQAEGDAGFSPALTAADQRSLAIMTHLHSSSTALRWDFAQDLVERRPFVVDVRTGLPGGIHLFEGAGINVDVGVSLAALNGELVGLCLLDGDGDEERVGSEDAKGIAAIWHRAFSVRPPAPGSARLVCLALVRSIDESNARVHLLCPPSLPDLIARTQAATSSNQQGRLAFVATGGSAAVSPPIFAFLDRAAFAPRSSGNGNGGGGDAGQEQQLSQSSLLLAGVPRQDAPYLTWPASSTSSSSGSGATAIVGAEKRRVRRNVMRRGQRG